MEYLTVNNQHKLELIATRIFEYEKEHYNHTLALLELESLDGVDTTPKLNEIEHIKNMLAVLRKELEQFSEQPTEPVDKADED